MSYLEGNPLPHGFHGTTGTEMLGEKAACFLRINPLAIRFFYDEAAAAATEGGVERRAVQVVFNRGAKYAVRAL